MKKIALTELTLLLFVAGSSVGLYHSFYGIHLHCDNYFDLITFELRRTITVLEILGIFFFPIYIIVNAIRLFYFKFLKLYHALEIQLASLLLAALLFYKYLFLSSESLVMANEGWTIYPPLTGLSALDEHDTAKLQNEQNSLLAIIALLLIASFTLTVVTLHRRKKNKPNTT